MTKYELYKFETGYSVTWYSEDYECEVCQDHEGGEIYPFSGWVEDPEFIGSYETLNDAWWAACIDPYLCKAYGDPRMHPEYSFRLKGIPEGR